MKKLFFALGACLFSLSIFAQQKDYGQNIISFNPLHAISNDNVGVGMSYERLVNDYVGIRIPVMAALNQPYFNLGIEAKLYPTKNNNRPVKYAIAPALMYGTGQYIQTTSYWNGMQYVETEKKVDRSHFGFLLNQTINFTIMQNFYLGLDGGLGINYYDNDSRYTNPNRNNRITLLGQFQMSVGVRF